MEAGGLDLGIDGIADAVLVGRGATAPCTAARQSRFHREVAVKVMLGDLDAASAIRFERECAAMGTLSGHPHIVTVFDSGIVGGQPYIIMEYLPGGSLHAALAAGPLGWVDVLDDGVKLAGALESAHRQGVLHRDVKPENVVLSGWGEPQLGDFGIARVQGAYETAAGKVTATLVHAAPELLAGQSPTAAADLYTLASSMFELWRAHLVLGARRGDHRTAAERIALDRPPDLRQRGIPAAVVEVIETDSRRSLPIVRRRWPRSVASSRRPSRCAGNPSLACS